MKVQGTYIHIDYAVSDGCINHWSCGCICVKCGCCKRNPDYRDMIRRRVKYYKKCLAEQYAFSDWCDNEKMRALQERNIKANIVYFKRKIRLYKKILRTFRKEQP